MKDGGKARNTIFCNLPHGPIRVWHLSSSSPLTCGLDLPGSLSLSPHPFHRSITPRRRRRHVCLTS